MGIQQTFLMSGGPSAFAGFSTPAAFNGVTTGNALGFATSAAANTNGYIVSVGSLFTGYAVSFSVSSNNGSTWTSPATFNGFTSSTASMSAVAANGSGLFVAVGYNGSPAQGLFTYSSDNASTWSTPAAMTSVTGGLSLFALGRNSSNLFVAVGYGTSSRYAYYVTSSNGTTWGTPAAMGTATVGAMYGVAVNSSGLYVAVGTTGLRDSLTGATALYATSSNGITWSTPAVSSAWTGIISYGLYAVAVNSSGLFVAVGNTASSGGWSTTSTNGTTWTSVVYFPSANFIPYGICCLSSGLFIAVGNFRSGSDYAAYCTSTDGVTWTSAKYAGGTGSAALNAVFYGVAAKGNIAIAVGTQNDNTTANQAYSIGQ